MIIAQQRVKEAAFLFLPQTSITGAVTKSNLKYPQIILPDSSPHILFPSAEENFYTLHASVVQPIYVGGRNTNTLRLARASLLEAQTRYDSAKRDATLAVKESFYKLLYSSAALGGCRGWLSEMSRQRAQAKLNAWESVEGEAALDKMEAEFQSLLQRYRLAKLSFLRALNKELDSVVAADGDFKPLPAKADLNRLMVWAMEMRPELKGEVYRAEMDAIAVNLAMSRRSPTVMLGANYDFVDTQFPLRNNGWEANLAVQFPLAYDFLTQITQKKAEQRQGALKRAAMQDKVRLELNQAYENNSYWQREVVSREAVYSRLKGRYSAAARENAATLSALSAAGAVYEAQLAYLEAVREQLVSRARLEWALGQEIPAE